MKIPPEIDTMLDKGTTFSSWDPKASSFEYGYYQTKFPEKQFPIITI